MGADRQSMITAEEMAESRRMWDAFQANPEEARKWVQGIIAGLTDKDKGAAPLNLPAYLYDQGELIAATNMALTPTQERQVLEALRDAMAADKDRQE